MCELCEERRYSTGDATLVEWKRLIDSDSLFLNDHTSNWKGFKGPVYIGVFRLYMLHNTSLAHLDSPIMPNAYLLSPTLDPFNPFQFTFDAPQEAVALSSPPSNFFTDVHCDYLSSTQQAVSYTKPSPSRPQGFDLDNTTPQAWFASSPNLRTSSVLSDIDQTGIGTNNSYVSWPLAPLGPFLRQSMSLSLSLPVSGCGDSDRLHPCRSLLIDEEPSQSVETATVATAIDTRMYSNHAAPTTKTTVNHRDIGGSKAGTRCDSAAVKRASAPLTATARSTHLTGKGHSSMERCVKNNRGSINIGKKINDSDRDSGAMRKTSTTYKKSGVHPTNNSNNNNNNRSNNDNAMPPHFKTEYCAKFQELGQCPFGDRCQFVHHEHELRPRIRALTYKTQHCKSGSGCPYQQNHSRCIFLHEGETAEMFNKDRRVPYAKVKVIQEKKRLKRQQQSQRQQEASAGKNTYNETLSEMTDIHQYNPSDVPRLVPELPMRSLSVSVSPQYRRVLPAVIPILLRPPNHSVLYHQCSQAS